MEPLVALIGVVVLSVVLVGALTAYLATVIRGDGWGHRPPPAGRRDWSAGTSVSDVR